MKAVAYKAIAPIVFVLASKLYFPFIAVNGDGFKSYDKNQQEQRK